MYYKRSCSSARNKYSNCQTRHDCIISKCNNIFGSWFNEHPASSKWMKLASLNNHISFIIVNSSSWCLFLSPSFKSTPLYITCSLWHLINTNSLINSCKLLNAFHAQNTSKHNKCSTFYLNNTNYILRILLMKNRNIVPLIIFKIKFISTDWRCIKCRW